MNRPTAQQEYGGPWTEKKLQLLRDYLEAYLVIFRKYPSLRPVYIDAFAGTGGRPDSSCTLVEKGSARIALEANDPAFAEYIFVETDGIKCQELDALKQEYPQQAERITVVHQDAATYLLTWCQSVDRRTTRAVIFLDPFGMQVEWPLLESLAETKIVDLWLLVPLGIGANRLMTRDGLPPPEWSEKLTRFFGSEEWQQRFYKPRAQPDLFEESSPVEKNVDHDALRSYFIERLKTIFSGVAENPLTQRNKNNSPMFLLCFATANPKPSVVGAALRIAQHLLKEG